MLNKVYNYESIILIELTLEKEKLSIPYRSKDYIWATCRYCGMPHRLSFEKYKSAGSACHKECSKKEKQQTSPFKNVSILHKCKDTLQRKYGVDNPQKSLIIRKKTAVTNKYKYGCENVFSSNDIKEKIKATHIKKYGVDNPAKSSDIKDKQRQSFLTTITGNDIYCVHNLLQNPLFWEQLKNQTLYEISIIHGIKYGSLLSALNEPKYKERYNLIYTYPKYQQQKELYNHLSKFIDCTINDRTVIAPYELDIYIPIKKFAIEYNGNYWHSEAILTPELAKNKHIIKTNLCLDKGIRLFHIFESHWLHKKEKLISCIKAALNCNQHNIYARECKVDDFINVKSFLDEFHLQGSCNYLKSFSLCYAGEIVGCLTLGRHHRQNTDQNSVVLNRLCYRSDYSVVGGSERLFSYAIKWAKDNGYSRIISWSDNATSSGNIYKRLGFIETSLYPPDYFYWIKNSNSYRSKQNSKKPKGCMMSERDFNISNGLYRIWDCGKKRWVYNIN